MALFRFLFLRLFKHQPKGKSGEKEKARIKQINDLRTGTDGYLYGFYHLKPPFLIFIHGKRIIKLQGWSCLERKSDNNQVFSDKEKSDVTESSAPVLTTLFILLLKFRILWCLPAHFCQLSPP